MLIDRQRELLELNTLLGRPAARLLAVSGRRRLGKTTLLTHWARESGHPHLYWVASHFPSSLLLQQFSQQIWQLNTPERRVPGNFQYETWSEALEALAETCQKPQKTIVILDEFPYAVQSEPGLPSALQNAWDHHLRLSNVCMVLCGSHVGMMDRLLGADAPLYGRMTGPLRIRTLPFSALNAFFPHYTAEERVATYAIFGGVPAYLEMISDSVPILQNLREHLFLETGLFRTDPDFLIGEQVRDLKNYQAVISAIAGGARQPTEIAVQAGFPHSASVDPYLIRLVEMDYVRRELPATVPLERREASRTSRYIITDNYLRFYFRFVKPNLELLAQRLVAQVEQQITSQLRAFIGMTTFEELCQQWLLAKARIGDLPFAVEHVGAHWGGGVQVDVVGINWHEKAILLGEAKWQVQPVGRKVIQELIQEKAPKVLHQLPLEGWGWTPYYVAFARSGFTEAAVAEMQTKRGLLVDLNDLDQTLSNNRAFAQMNEQKPN